jgi:hypothetical protein
MARASANADVMPAPMPP